MKTKNRNRAVIVVFVMMLMIVSGFSNALTIESIGSRDEIDEQQITYTGYWHIGTPSSVMAIGGEWL